MPRENRKRGKKYKKNANIGLVPEQLKSVTEDQDISTGPSGALVTFSNTKSDSDAPFGYVSDNLKAYFRTIDIQIRDWQQQQGHDSYREETDVVQDKHILFMAALSEMSGNEKQLATDPTCSIILERMMYSMDDFVRRVFMDRLAGSYDILVRHRFASHVCQTLFTVAADTVSRECQNILPTVPESSSDGELLKLTHLVLNICEELLLTFTSLILDPFASHVIRAILLLLCPDLGLSDPRLPSKQYSNLRSKKSTAWKVRQGPMQCVFEDIQESSTRKKIAPPEFRVMSSKFVHTLRDTLNGNEIRALATNKVACPVLQVLLEIEANQEIADAPGSLLDQITFGLVSIREESRVTLPEPSDYVTALLRDPTSSHIVESIVRRAPNDIFSALWSTYFRPYLKRLTHHPIANFVVARTVERLSADQLLEALRELKDTWHKSVQTSRLGVLRAVIDRAVALRSCEQDVVSAVCSAFGLNAADSRNLLVPCAIRVMPIQAYKASLPPSSDRPNNSGNEDDAIEPKVQGALLLQSLIHFAEPYNHIVIDSLQSLAIDELTVLACHPTSSRILDAYLESSTIPFKTRRRLIVSFIGHYHLLVDDRIGSRIADRCWAFADSYLKEKIARSLIPHEHFLAGSPYGKFFVRNLNLSLLQRRPEQWKNMQAERNLVSRGETQTAVPPSSAVEKHAAPVMTDDLKRKRNTGPEDEIDVLFDSMVGKKTRRGALGLDDLAVEKSRETLPSARFKEALQDVFGAIRAAPKAEKRKKT